jgi:hypothetical protein
VTAETAVTEMTEFARQLGFTSAWFDLGIVDDAVLFKLKSRWDEGTDPHTEHYRYAAFREFLEGQRPLTPELASALFELGAADPEPGMGTAMMADIVHQPECPESLLQAALASGREYVVRAVERRKTE